MFQFFLKLLIFSSFPLSLFLFPSQVVVAQVSQQLPVKYTGVWKGFGFQNNGSKWNMLFSLTRANSNSIVGTSSYPSLRCGGELTLKSVNSDSVDILEKITYGNCLDGVIRMKFNEEPTVLEFYWLDDKKNAAIGILRKN